MEKDLSGFEAHCEECHLAMKLAEEDYDYKECGIPNIVLKNVVTRTCKDCHRVEYIFDAEEADKNIASYIVEKEEKLSFEETRFLFNFAIARMEGHQYFGVDAEA
jgi:hypothetical protein